MGMQEWFDPPLTYHLDPRKNRQTVGRVRGIGGTKPFVRPSDDFCDP